MQPVLTVLKGSDARRRYKPPARPYHLFYYTGFVNTFTENGRTFYPYPPLRGTSFHRKEGVSTRAPSLGRGCRAQRGGVGFLFCGEAASSLPSPCRESDVILVPSSTTSIALTRAIKEAQEASFASLIVMHFPAEIRCIHCLMSFRIAAEGKTALPEVFLFADVAFDRPAIEESTDIEE